MTGNLVDWAATGQMLSGVGTLAGALAVAYAAHKGSDTFKQWRAQKTEQRRIDLAEEVLTKAYDFQRTIRMLRSPATYVYEAEEAIKSLEEEYEGFRSLHDGKKRSLETAQVILHRAMKYKETFQAVSDLMPVSKAVFGDAVFSELDSLWRCMARVRAAAQTYGNAADDGGELRRKMESVFWEGASDPDEVANQIADAIQRLDAHLLPVLRAA